MRTNRLRVLATISSRALPEWRLWSWQVEKLSIIAVHECICNVVQSRHFVILLNVEVQLVASTNHTLNTEQQQPRRDKMCTREASAACMVLGSRMT